MDARDRLRRYLEQRRELGESELVLDGMEVDEVMALLGARQSARSARSAQAPVSAMTPPEAPPAATGEQHDAAPAIPEAVAPPAPAPRFDTSASGDWRQALSQSNPGAAQGSDARAASSASRTPATNTSATVGASANASAGAGATAPAELPAWVASLGIPAGISRAASAPTSGPEANALTDANTLESIAELIAACKRCGLHASARNHVPGVGNPAAELMCVGEAPGASEDEQGQPFVGEAGQLLTKILAAIDLPRESVFICNVLKHRPPANRDPLPDEVVACQPFLERQVDVVKPKVILALGRFAAQTLLGTTSSLGKLREHVHLYHGIPVIVTYHPAALLRNEAWKRPTWADVKLARRILDASRAQGGDAHRGSASDR